MTSLCPCGTTTESRTGFGSANSFLMRWSSTSACSSSTDVRRHLPQRRLHPHQDVRAPRRPRPRRAPGRPSGGRRHRRQGALDRDRDRVFGRIDLIRRPGGTTAPTGAVILRFTRPRRFTGSRAARRGSGRGADGRRDRRRRRQSADRPGGRRGVGGALPDVRHGDAHRDAARRLVISVGLHRRGVRARLLGLRRRVSVVGRSSPMLRGQDETIAERFTALAHDRGTGTGAGALRSAATATRSCSTWPTARSCRGDLLLSPPAGGRTVTG